MKRGLLFLGVLFFSCAIPVGPGWSYEKGFSIEASEGTFSDKIVVQWRKISGATGYNLFRCDIENGVYDQINIDPVTSTVFEDTDLTPNFGYFYKVQAVLSAQKSDFSKAVFGYSVPVGLTATFQRSISKLTLSFRPVPGAHSYVLLACATEDGVYSSLGLLLTGLEGATVDSEGFLTISGGDGETLSFSFNRSRETGSDLFMKIRAVYFISGGDPEHLFSKPSNLVIDYAEG